MKENSMNGSKAVLESLLQENVTTIFGYPGGAIMPVYDALYDYADKLKHFLVRHEQGAIHAAQGYARATGNVGVCIVTSGPGATNTTTGLADAMMDSTPLVVISGQVGASLIGTDAFQETNFIGLTQPITKWNTIVKKASDIPAAIAKGFYIAKSGRPGPVVIDITKSAQLEMLQEFSYNKLNYMRSCLPTIEMDPVEIERAVELIKHAKRPMIIAGQGVVLSGAEAELKAFAEKADFPVTTSLLGLPGISTDHPNFVGMIGMHGYYAPNMHLNQCDLILSIGARFDDRLTGDADRFATNAKVIHIDIDHSELGKIVKTEVELHADAKACLALLTDKIDQQSHSLWRESFTQHRAVEHENVIDRDINPKAGCLKMPEMIYKITKAYDGNAVVVTDVGQHQMFTARYAVLNSNRGLITSGGLGTMGFGLPAAIGAKVGQPSKEICLFVGDGGIQMSVQELATIMQYRIGVKIILLNNNFLGMVRQWQEMFFDKRYSFTEMTNPDFSLIAQAHQIGYSLLTDRSEIEKEVSKLKAHDGPYILEVRVESEDNVFPMVPTGCALEEVRFN